MCIKGERMNWDNPYWLKPPSIDDWKTPVETSWHVLMFAQGALLNSCELFLEDPEGVSLEPDEEYDEDFEYEDDDGRIINLGPPDPDVRVAEHASYLQTVAKALKTDLFTLLESIDEDDQYEPLKAQIERGNAKIDASWEKQ